MNRGKFLKIFETHQFKGCLTFPDIVNICTSLKVFPDLLDEQSIENLYNSVSPGGSKINLPEFEDLLKKIAVKLYSNISSYIDPFKYFVEYIKIPAFNSYGVSLKNLLTRNNNSLKVLSTKKTAVKPVLKPQTTKNCQVSYRAKVDIDPLFHQQGVRRNSKLYTQNSAVFQITSEVLKKFSMVHPKKSIKKHLEKRKLRSCILIKSLNGDMQTNKRLYFYVWKLMI